jgi:glycosyltransferase involved in cell wall biosynthesis
MNGESILSSNKLKSVSILGIRGIPAAHGGFETFAEKLALYLAERNWEVIVYCQTEGGALTEEIWNGIRLIKISSSLNGAAGTILFDLKCVLHSLKKRNTILTLGYNTAIFNGIYRLFFRTNLINMDGIEWKRAKWGRLARFWFWFNEYLGSFFGNHLVADHPEIKKHLCRHTNGKKITMIPYGADSEIEKNIDILHEWELESKSYFIIIARPEPENSILEMVRAFSSEERKCKLVILGTYFSEENSYHKKVIDAASHEVVFLGSIYDQKKVSALRFHAIAYLHGHQVGGTNPSLVESLGVSNAIIAHDNAFNRWVASESALYFSNELECSECFDRLIHDLELRNGLQEKAHQRYKDAFQWDFILSQYEKLLEGY